MKLINCCKQVSMTESGHNEASIQKSVPRIEKDCMDKRFVKDQCWNVVTRLPRDCWVCGKPLGSDDDRLDEFGFSVHTDCYTKLMEEKLVPPADPNP